MDLIYNDNPMFDLGDLDIGRERLGLEMPVKVYRMFHFALKNELIKQFGKEKAKEIFVSAGLSAGTEYALRNLDLNLEFNQFIAQLQADLKINKKGLLRMEEYDKTTGYCVLTVSEDLDCSGLPITNETSCNYDEGFLTGILRTYTKLNYVVTEIDCWSTGARVCRFEAKVVANNND